MACATLFFLTSMQPSFSRVTPVCMTSLGETRNEIEYTTRLLNENKLAVRVTVKKIVRMGLRPGKTMKEFNLLKANLERLEKRDEELHDEMGRLIVNAVWNQIRGGEEDST
jgi:hypothetical protein